MSDGHGHGHEHGHEHGHGHGHPGGMSDGLVLDIGGDVGALLIHAGPELSEIEIEISPGSGESSPRSHNMVHARQNRQGTRYTAVFPSVPAGTYTIWRPDGPAKALITVRGGQVTEHHWDS